MNNDAEMGGAIGRYPARTIDRVLYSVMGVLFILAGAPLGRSNFPAFAFLLGGCLFLLYGWVLPATVITRTGFRRGRLLRLVPWSEVTTVYPPPAGGHVQVGLRRGKVVALEGVCVDLVPAIIELAASTQRSAWT